ncbi:MAG TPA: hypothetical protein VGG39_10205 [Polyangiaceae bacterium]|jgi:hypothetical protein
MMGYRKNGIVAQRFAERRQREDEAPRLGDQVPNLRGLRLEIEERAGDLGLKHVRHVVVGSAPALFIVLCGDSECHEGEHDLTGPIMRALRAGSTRFDGEDVCNGSVGSLRAECTRVLHFDAVATYAS